MNFVENIKVILIMKKNIVRECPIEPPFIQKIS